MTDHHFHDDLGECGRWLEDHLMNRDTGRLECPIPDEEKS